MATNPFGQSPFGGAAAGKTDEKQSKQDLPYTATGIASRDNVRKMIWEIFEDNNKNLLFAMGNGGIYKFNGKSFDKTF